MKENNAIAKQSPIMQKMAEHWPLITALIGGTKAMRDAGRDYLPQWPGESDDSYNTRIKVATLHPAFKRTVKVLAAKPFSKAIEPGDDVPDRIKQLFDDIDLQGRNLQAFASLVFNEALSYGISGVLVEAPIRASNIITQADEKAAGIRPFLVHYSAWNILGWRTELINGYDRLIQLRLKEYKIEPDGDYGEKTIEYVRVLTPGKWEIWKQNGKKEWVLHNVGVTNLTEIPFVMFYGMRTGAMTGEPPLLELAYQNVEHYQSSSDQQNILHASRVPILTMIGANDSDEITIGAAKAVKLPMGADMKFVEHSGAAIGAGRQSIIDLEERMRQSGAELLLIKPGQATATEISSDNEGNKCDLQRSTESAEDSLDQCLQFMADMFGEKDGGSVSLFKDFGVATLSDASAQLLLAANQSGKISDFTLLLELKRRGILAPELDVMEEKDRIDEQGPALGMLGADSQLVA